MFAVFFASVMRSLQDGAWEYLVHNVASFHTGYLQIQNEEYIEIKSLKHSIDPKEIKEVLGSQSSKYTLAPRIENFGLATKGTESKAAFIVGIDPLIEPAITSVNQRVINGRYLEKTNDVLLANGIANILGAQPGDSIVLLSQGKGGGSSFGMFTVAGIVEFGSPDLNRQLVFLGIKDANALFRMGGHLTSLVVAVEDEENMELAENDLSKYLKSPIAVLNYEAMLPEIMQAKEFDKLSGGVVLGVLYLLIGFGVFGTILMMLKEREYEFGILKAIGWQSKQLYVVILIESVIIAILGAILGILLAAPIVYYFEVFPIRFTGEYAAVYESFGLEAVLPFKLDFGILSKQALVVTALTVLLSTYAAIKIARLTPVKAMRG